MSEKTCKNCGVIVYDAAIDFGECPLCQASFDKAFDAAFGETVGVKHDDGKLRFDLVLPELEEGVAAVLTHGDSKYGTMVGGKESNWKHVEPKRFIAALKRHLTKHLKAMEGISVLDFFDKDSNLMHLDHAACCIMLLKYFALQDEKIKKEYERVLENKEYLFNHKG